MNKTKVIASVAVGLMLVLALAGIPRGKKRASSESIQITSTAMPAVPVEENPEPILVERSQEGLPPDVNRVAQLFNPFPPHHPIVETVTYAAKVPWLTGRAAYLGDYASHHKTSKHFISRSLKGEGDYFSENVSKGDRFNVLRNDHEIEFHMVLDLSRLKMWLFAVDQTEGARYLLKSYPVCAGRLNPSKPSGSLTPVGIYKLGEEIAVYKENSKGTYKGNDCEMITIFGVRWIPFGKEIAGCTAPAKGLGFHGLPWKRNEAGQLIEHRHSIGKYSSNGCIRLLTEDMEEIFSIIITKPSYVHIVKDFSQADLPGREV